MVANLAKAIRVLANMEEPTGRVLTKFEIADGLVLEKTSSPLGVLLIILMSWSKALVQVCRVGGIPLNKYWVCYKLKKGSKFPALDPWSYAEANIVVLNGDGLYYNYCEKCTCLIKVADLNLQGKSKTGKWEKLIPAST
ncbi:Delta-1-pyrroline-5-carboxylate synthase [Orobanche minor]